LSHRPRKRFGQNFLHDPAVIARTVAAINPSPGDCLLEIGPGQGALTGALLAHLPHLHVVELDRDLAAALRAGPLAQRLTVHEMDALRFDLATLDRDPVRVVGNLPYNISSPLLFHMLSQVARIQDMHFMLQKEVVARMAAAPGGRIYGRLSVMVQAQCEVELLFTVGPGAFRPAPKVDSAVVRLRPRSRQPSASLLSALDRLTARAFGQRRKTLRNALRGMLQPAQLEALGVDPGQRAETLDVGTFVAMARAVAATPETNGRTCG
jgi:16S rRNA (adenine1518-N6/adenine1519-N6)-dimethyltransferase